MRFGDATHRLVCAFMVSFLAACGGGADNQAAAADPLSCFPAEARPWIAASQEAGAAQNLPAGRAGATVYVDRSGSMVGYVQGATRDNSPFQDLILNLPVRLQRQRLETTYRAFGTTLTDPLPNRQLVAPEFYTCPAGGCDNQESRLDIVFAEIAGKPNEMGLVLTDLWFSSSEVTGSALTALDGPLNAVLSSGRGVAVYGIPAPFAGLLHDVPGAGGPVQFAGDHPLFLVAVGTAVQLDLLDRELRANASPRLRDGLADGSIKRSLFATAPVAQMASARPFGGAEVAPVLEQIRTAELPPTIDLQQFRLRRADAMRLEDAAGRAPSWVGPRAASFPPGALWQGEYRPRTRVWERRNQNCAEDSWLELALPESLWSAEGEGHRFRLAPDILAAELTGSGPYLLVGNVSRANMAPAGAATEWMRQWSFEPGTEAQAALNGRRFFKTLYLGELAHQLEGALASVVRQQGKAVQGFAVILNVED